MRAEHVQVGGTYRVVKGRFSQPEKLTGSLVEVKVVAAPGLFLVGEGLFPLNPDELMPIVLEDNV